MKSMMLLVAIAAVMSGCAYSGRLNESEMKAMTAAELLQRYEGEALFRADWAYAKKLKQATLDAYGYPPDEVAKIQAGTIWTGMSRAQLILAWGPRLRKSQTTTALGTIEVWDYGTPSQVMDVYLRDGVVTGWTESNY